MAFSQQHARASKDKWTPLFSLSLSLSLFLSFLSSVPSLSLCLSLFPAPHVLPTHTKRRLWALQQSSCTARLVSSPLSSSSFFSRRRRLSFHARGVARRLALGGSRNSRVFFLFFLFFFSFFSFLFFSFFSFFFLFFFFLKKSIQNRFFLSVSLVYFSCVFFQVSKMKFVKKNKKIGFFKRIISFVSNGSEGKQGERKTKENRRKLFVNRLPFSERKRG